MASRYRKIMQVVQKAESNIESYFARRLEAVTKEEDERQQHEEREHSPDPRLVLRQFRQSVPRAREPAAPSASPTRLLGLLDVEGRGCESVRVRFRVGQQEIVEYDLSNTNTTMLMC